jgi:hypothetical protein
MTLYIAIVVYAGEVHTAGIYKTHTEAQIEARRLLIRMLAEGGFSDHAVDTLDDDKGEFYRFEVLPTDYRI